jgi:bacterioferritin-associated ferredoxin
LGVATQCGRCEGCAREVIAQCSSSQPMAAAHNRVEPVVWLAAERSPVCPSSLHLQAA